MRGKERDKKKLGRRGYDEGVRWKRKRRKGKHGRRNSVKESDAWKHRRGSNERRWRTVNGRRSR